MSDDYTRIHVRVQAVRPRAALIVHPVSNAGDWCPRSLIHGVDDARLDKVAVGEELTLRVMSWKVKQLGLG